MAKKKHSTKHDQATTKASNLITTALDYMHDEMGHPDAQVVEQIVRECEALVLFDNDLCLHLQSYGWCNDRWEVMNETDAADYHRNK
ncbi:MAG: hypothetical protein RIC55_36235 [Pirellulaceae bacterium]